MRATLKNYQQAPRKVRLVADFIRGKRVAEADTELAFLAKRAARPMRKLLQSAVANAEQNFTIRDTEELYVREVHVNKGMTLKRFRPRAFGRAFPINKYASHIDIILGRRVKKGTVPQPKNTTTKSDEKVTQ